MSAFRFDHVVIVVRDLPTAMEYYTRLGFSVMPGGEHPAFNTHNALIPFIDGSYLELLATRESMYFTYLQAALQRDILDDELPDDSLPTRRFLSALARGEGVADFALIPEDMERAMMTAGDYGVNYEGPFPGSRAKPDGSTISWQFAMERAGKLPFLIADETPRPQRVPTEERDTRHANGTAGITSVELFLPDMTVIAQDYAALLGPPAIKTAAHTAFSIGAGGWVILRQANSDRKSNADRIRVTLRNPLVGRAQIGFHG